MDRHLDESVFVDQHGIDLRKPLYHQVASLGDKYFDWVHDPIRKSTLNDLREWDQGKWPGSVRIFDSEWLEVMTHISWKLVLAIWLPITLLLLVVSRAVFNLGWGTMAGSWAAGLVGWTLVEYILHRFFFHTPPKSAGGIQAHFLAHGIHHYDPFDGTRLVFPPLAGAGIAVVLYLLLDLFIPSGAACAAMSGLLSGYLLYDMSHYHSHHGKIRDPWFRFLSRYHKAHHHRDPDALFGVSNPFWDLVFRTGTLKI